MSLLFRLFLCVSCVFVIASCDGDLGNTELYACFTFLPKLNMNFVEAKLTQGQWTVSATDKTPTSSPKGILIPSNEKRSFCSSGYKGDQTGTIGTVTVEDNSGQQIVLNWEDTSNSIFKYTIAAKDPSKYHILTIPVAAKVIEFEFIPIPYKE